MFISESKYLIKAPPFKPIHTCNDRMQPHPPPTPGLQRRSRLRSIAPLQRSERPPATRSDDAKTRGARQPQRRSIAKTRRGDEPPGGIAASQHREDAKTLQRRGTASRRREDARSPQRRRSVAALRQREDTKPSTSHLAASQRRDTAKTRKPSRSVAVSQRLTASEPTWRTHCIYIYIYRDVYKRFILCICLMSVQICRFIQVFSVYRRLSRHATPSPQEPVPTSQEAGIWLGKWSIDG